jgi:nucleotide-binding universal stress UspA family protein
MTRITAFIDASAYTESVTDHAAWVSRTTGYGLDLVHVVDHRRRTAPLDFTGNLALGARTRLMDTLTKHDAEASRLAREAGAAVLDAAKIHAETAGAVDVHAKLRTGDMLDAVKDFETGSRLVVVGKRGSHADFAAGHLGSNLERVVRAAHRPVLVASRAFKQPTHAVIAFDGGESVGKAISHIADGALFSGVKLTLLNAGRRDDGLEREMDAAATLLKDAGHQVETVFAGGEPEKVILGHVADTGADLLIMGAYGHSRIRTLIIGSTTTEMVRACRVPVMLFRPDMG